MRDKNPKRIQAKKEYAQTEGGKIARSRAQKKWLDSNLVKRSVHVIVGNAIRDGKLKKNPCEKCGKEIVEAHHDDYSNPLDVRWLCGKHHKQWHKENGEGKNA